MAMFESLRSVVRFRGIELDSVERRLARAANIGDLRSVARRRLPGGVFDYIDGGAEDEWSLDNNSSAFQRYEFDPRVLVGVETIDTSAPLHELVDRLVDEPDRADADDIAVLALRRCTSSVDPTVSPPLG